MKQLEEGPDLRKEDDEQEQDNDEVDADKVVFVQIGGGEKRQKVVVVGRWLLEVRRQRGVELRRVVEPGKE